MSGRAGSFQIRHCWVGCRQMVRAATAAAVHEAEPAPRQLLATSTSLADFEIRFRRQSSGRAEGNIRSDQFQVQADFEPPARAPAPVRAVSLLLPAPVSRLGYRDSEATGSGSGVYTTAQGRRGFQLDGRVRQPSSALVWHQRSGLTSEWAWRTFDTLKEAWAR